MKTWILLVNNSVTKAKFTDKIYQVNDEPKVKHGVSLGKSVNGRVKLEPRSLRSQAKIQLMDFSLSSVQGQVSRSCDISLHL